MTTTLVWIFGALAAIFIATIIVCLVFGRRWSLQGTLDPRENQLAFVQNGSYFKRRLLNGEEYQLFQHLEPWMKRQRGGYRLFAQVSLGEIVGADDPMEYACVNSKRCDFVVIDPKGYPALAIEYQGSGHYTANADDRDTVKRLALEGAGVPVVEVLEHYYWPEVLDDIETALGLRKLA